MSISSWIVIGAAGFLGSYPARHNLLGWTLHSDLLGGLREPRRGDGFIA